MNFASLQTIKDFDFGIAVPNEECVRISNIPENQVSDSEVNLILWILLEQRYADLETSSCGEDQIDCPSSRPRDSSKLHKDSSKVHSLQSLSSQQNAQARQYTENLLRCVGVNVPFKLLSSSEKKRLFQQFCESSNLLLAEKYSSILDLYEALRRRSKFREQFRVLSRLGEGRYGIVYKVCVLETTKNSQLKTSSTLDRDSSERQGNGNKDMFAIKKINLSFDGIEDVKMILNESAILKKLKGHSRVVTFHNSWLAMEFEHEESDSSKSYDDSLVFYLQMELCGISLHQWKINLKHEQPSEEKCLLLAKQLAEGASWIHENGFLHLDINPRNIFWTDENMDNIKIGDYGLAVQSNSFLGRRGGLLYCAPESELTSKSDMYSIGVTLFEMAQVFSTRSELITRLEKRDFETGMHTMDHILQNLLNLNPSERWDASQLKSFFTEC